MPVTPWTNVEPSNNPAAILGELPQTQESVCYAIDDSVVPDAATGVMIFAWYAASGVIRTPGWWHFSVNVGGGVENWFSLMIAGTGPAKFAAPCNSQVFWLPMPVDRMLTVTFHHGELPPGSCVGGVEIHGYSVS